MFAGMTETACPVKEPLMRAPTHAPQTDTGAYGDRISDQFYNSIAPGAEILRCVGAIDSSPHLPPRTTSRFNVINTPDYFQPSHMSSALRHNEFGPPPQFTYPLYSPFSTGSGSVDAIPTACRNPDFPKPSDSYSGWDSFHPSLDLLPNATCDVALSTVHHSTLGPTPYPNSPCFQPPWPNEGIRAGSVDEVPPTLTTHELRGFSPLDSCPPLHPSLDNTSEPYSAALDASFPCQWMKGSVICNVMVQATRSHMNRHLHVYHGFGGSDARQTTCHWVGCGTTMQQGSIARHMVTCHLQAKVTCPMCFKKLSRQDVISKHQRVCPAAGTWH